MTGVLIRKGEGTEIDRGEGHVRIEAEIGAMCLYVQERQG